MSAHKQKWFAALLVVPSALTPASNYETNEIQLNAADLAPKEWLSGSYHQITSPVTVKGLSNVYSIESPFGSFSATGDIQLRIRLHEIEAIAGLKAIDRSELAAQSAGQVLTRPIDTLTDVVDQPVETLKGVPAGVSRWFKRTNRRVRDGYETVKEAVEQPDDDDTSDSSGGKSGDTGQKILDTSKKYAQRFLGLDKAYRSLARQFKVDPYTDNEILRQELKDVSRYAAAGSFGAKQFSLSLPSAMDTLKDVRELVWDSDPLDLLIRNEEALRKMGARDALQKQFFENRYFTPTQQTIIVSALEAMSDVGDRLVLIEYASEAHDKEDAAFILRIVEFFHRYHTDNAPLARIVATNRLPLSINQNGTVVLFAPVDYLRWLELVSEASDDLSAVANKMAPGKTAELWVQGRISQQAEANLTAAGWRTIPHAYARLSRSS